jgi:hypothetical protein
MRRDVLTDARPRFIDAARAYVGFASTARAITR